jgi:general secretion pathway protein H
MPIETKRVLQGQSGFSIVELLVVLAVMAIGLALAAAALNRARSALVVRGAAYELAGHLRSVRAAATRQSIQRAFVFERAAHRYWAEGIVAPRTLPPSVLLDLQVPESERIGRDGWVRFLPDGSASGARIVLKSGASSWAVLVDWLSGEVRVQPGS